MSLNIIKKYLREGLKSSNIWYHGTPDVTALENEGGFSSRNMSVDYISDLEGYYGIQSKLKQSREAGDDKAYFKYLDMVPKFKATFNMRKPVFLSNDSSVAKTYADPRRAFDYQNAKEKLLKVELSDGKTVTIVATGDRFRFINTDKGIKTDVVAVLGEWFGFDYVDVVGVLDSHQGGSIKSTVRMVFDPSRITIIE